MGATLQDRPPGGYTQADIAPAGDLRYTQKANNLSDVASASAARVNIGAAPATLAQQVFLSADVSLSNTASYFDVLSTSSLGVAGEVWEIKAVLSVQDTGGNASYLVRIWDGTNVYAESPFAVLSGNEGVVTISALVTLTGATTFKLSCKDRSFTTGKALTTGNAGTLHKATSITAIRVAA